MGSDPAQAMLDLLDRERAALLGGRIAEMNRLATEKERLAATLGGAGDAGRAVLARVREATGRNAALLAAARRGIEAARAQLSALGAGGPALETYDRHGQRRRFDGGHGRLERRA